MFQISEYNKIQLTKGDTATFTIDIVDDEGKEYVRQSGDKLIFTTQFLSKEAVIDNGNWVFILAGSETVEQEPGLYTYDIKLESEDNVYTIIQESIFELLGVVENEG